MINMQKKIISLREQQAINKDISRLKQHLADSPSLSERLNILSSIDLTSTSLFAINQVILDSLPTHSSALFLTGFQGYQLNQLSSIIKSQLELVCFEKLTASLACFEPCSQDLMVHFLQEELNLATPSGPYAKELRRRLGMSAIESVNWSLSLAQYRRVPFLLPNLPVNPSRAIYPLGGASWFRGASTGEQPILWINPRMAAYFLQQFIGQPTNGNGTLTVVPKKPSTNPILVDIFMNPRRAKKDNESAIVELPDEDSADAPSPAAKPPPRIVSFQDWAAIEASPDRPPSQNLPTFQANLSVELCDEGDQHVGQAIEISGQKVVENDLFKASFSLAINSIDRFACSVETDSYHALLKFVNIEYLLMTLLANQLATEAFSFTQSQLTQLENALNNSHILGVPDFSANATTAAAAKPTADIRTMRRHCQQILSALKLAITHRFLTAAALDFRAFSYKEKKQLVYIIISVCQTLEQIDSDSLGDPSSELPKDKRDAELDLKANIETTLQQAQAFLTRLELRACMVSMKELEAPGLIVSGKDSALIRTLPPLADYENIEFIHDLSLEIGDSRHVDWILATNILGIPIGDITVSKLEELLAQLEGSLASFSVRTSFSKLLSFVNTELLFKTFLQISNQNTSIISASKVAFYQNRLLAIKLDVLHRLLIIDLPDTLSSAHMEQLTYLLASGCQLIAPLDSTGDATLKKRIDTTIEQTRQLLRSPLLQPANSSLFLTARLSHHSSRASMPLLTLGTSCEAADVLTADGSSSSSDQALAATQPPLTRFVLRQEHDTALHHSRSISPSSTAHEVTTPQAADNRHRAGSVLSTQSRQSFGAAAAAASSPSFGSQPRAASQPNENQPKETPGLFARFRRKK